MNTPQLISVCFATVILFSGCEKPEPAQTQSDSPQQSPITGQASAPAPGAAPAIDMQALKPAPSATPSPAYYLVVAKSMETDDGITGIPAGTKLKRGDDGSFSFMGKPLTVSPDEVTNDPVEIEKLLARINATDSARRRVATTRALPPPPTPSEPSPVLHPVQIPAGAPPVANMGEAHDNTKDKLFSDASGRYWKDARGRRHYVP